MPIKVRDFSTLSRQISGTRAARMARDVMAYHQVIRAMQLDYGWPTTKDIRIALGLPHRTVKDKLQYFLNIGLVRRKKKKPGIADQSNPYYWNMTDLRVSRLLEELATRYDEFDWEQVQ